MQAQVLALAVKTAVGGPMREIDRSVGQVDGGLDCPVQPSPDRGITFLAARQWDQVNEELGTEMPWHARRANVLLDADGLADLLGRTVTVGDLRVEIMGETVPCGTMEAIQPGLTRALAPECRGGVYGRILRGGTIRVGDALTIE